MQDHQYDIIVTKLDKLDERLNVLTIDVVRNSVVLEEHQKRSVANEQNVEILRTEVREDFKPLKRHIVAVETILKTVGALGVFVGVVASGLKIIAFFRPS